MELTLRLELEVVVVVGTDFVETAEPVVEHAHVTNVRFEVEVIGCVFSRHKRHTVTHELEIATNCEFLQSGAAESAQSTGNDLLHFPLTSEMVQMKLRTTTAC